MRADRRKKGADWLGKKEGTDVMARTVGIGIQSFEKIIENNYLYIDKTDFIREWWESGDDVTLITRPRRFGKTLNMSMTERFFSIEYAGQGQIFEGLSIWKHEKYRKLQGTWPVIMLSFAGVKETVYQNAQKRLCHMMTELYNRYDFLLDGGTLNEAEGIPADQIRKYGFAFEGKKVLIGKG